MERVSRAFLFHEELATQDEGASLEEALEHVLWYFPSEASRPERVKHVGLAQALLSYSDRFEQQQKQQQQQQQRRRRRRRRQRPQGARDAVGGGDGDEKGTGKARGARDPSGTLSSRVEVVRTSRHCHGFLECEPGVWLVMVVANRRRQQQEKQQQQQQQQPERQQWQRQRRREGGGFLGGDAGVGVGVGGRGGEAVGGGAGGDWVDEVALREAMWRAYATFALMHGSVSDALRAPVTIQPPGCSSDRGLGRSGGVGGGGTVSGFEVLRRLASARKRLRKAKREAGEVPQEISGAEPAYPENKGKEQVDADADAGAEAEAEGGRGQQMASPRSSPFSSSYCASSRWKEKLAESHAEEGDDEVAALLRASPAKAVRESLRAFFAGYLPGVGLAEPHFHLDMGYPQSLPTDLYRRQLGLRIQRRVRKRIRSLLGTDSSSNAASDVDFDIDIAATLGAGALMLAGMDPEPLVLSPSTNGDAVRDLKNGDGGIDDGRRKDGANEAGDGGEEEDGSDAQDGRGNVPELPRVEESPEAGPGNETGRAPQDQHQRRQGEGVVLEGREAALLMEYLGAAAFTAAGKQRTAQAPPAPMAELSAAAGSNTARASASLRRNGQGVRPAETKNPQRTLWATLRNEPASDCDGGDGGVRSATAALLAGPSGLLRRDGSLAPCGGDGSAPHPAGDLSDCAIWAPELHRMGRQSTGDLVGADQEEEQERSTVSAAARDEIGRRPRLRRSVVAYVRGGLCALVALRDRDKNDASASLGGRERSPGAAAGSRGDRAGTCASPQHNAEGEAAEKASPREAQEETEAGRELRASASKVPGCGWNQLELLSLGRAIETSLSEDPDLAVLEDDVRDFYFQSEEVVGVSRGRERQQSRHHRHHSHSQQQLPLIPGPVRAVHHQSSPFPCFAGAGLVHHPVAPTHQAEVSNTNVAKAASTHVCVPEGAGEPGTEHTLSATTTAVAFESSPDAGAPADAASSISGSCRCSGKSGGWLMVGEQRRPFDGCGVHDTSSGSGYKFVALIHVFGQKGRPDIGVKEIRRRGLGGEQELAAFDDIHARLKLQPAALELGIRTSMSKGHRWVIGRLQRASSGNDSSCEIVGGEMYATIEAPVLSVGDARAAAGRIFSGIGNDCSMTSGASHGAGQPRAQVAGLGRRRYLR